VPFSKKSAAGYALKYAYAFPMRGFDAVWDRFGTIFYSAVLKILLHCVAF
jgi:hypothetical protein